MKYLNFFMSLYKWIRSECIWMKFLFKLLISEKFSLICNPYSLSLQDCHMNPAIYLIYLICVHVLGKAFMQKYIIFLIIIFHWFQKGRGNNKKYWNESMVSMIYHLNLWCVDCDWSSYLYHTPIWILFFLTCLSSYKRERGRLLAFSSIINLLILISY